MIGCAIKRRQRGKRKKKGAKVAIEVQSHSAKALVYTTRTERWFETYHFKSPHPTDPNLDLPLNTFHFVKLDALPPASTGWFSTEKKKLLRHSNRTVVG